MSPDPRYEGDYSTRQVEAARRVLVDVGQVLASLGDAIVVVGGWVPDLLIPSATSAHIGSIDVDLALDAAKLADGRYAELLKLLLDTGRYHKGDKDFQLVTTVDLGDAEQPVMVEVEFLAADEVELTKNHPKLVQGFRVLPDFLVMKAHAIGGRDKPKDVYDLCYCLDQFPDAIEVVAAAWRARRDDVLVAGAVAIVKEKFQSVEHYGPQQLAVFHFGGSPDDSEMLSRRAYELVRKLLSLL